MQSPAADTRSDGRASGGWVEGKAVPNQESAFAISRVVVPCTQSETGYSIGHNRIQEVIGHK